uniref:Tumor necrosis factor receptor superfamily member 18 n=1 Tax=Camelus bactrianus TaxID=9837 RepID=A0A9W3G8S3_CAMBA|nr:tumor necrosis factor receptor superfamily member 18 [Camelus bactrianus]
MVDSGAGGQAGFLEGPGSGGWGPWLPCPHTPIPLEGWEGATWGGKGLARLLRGLIVSCPAEGVCPEQDCTCIQSEFHCGDPQCKSCKHHSCPPGQEAWPVGNFNFGFECVDCALGTFSGGHEGRCRPWADCSQLGFLTTFPGNTTHNAVCSPGLLPDEPPSLLTVVLLAVAICILALTVAQLGLHIWQLRRQRMWPPETPLLLEAPAPAPEDTCSKDLWV